MSGISLECRKSDKHLTPIVWDDSTLESAARGEFRIYRLGWEVRYKLGTAERRRFERARDAGFIDSKDGAAVACYWTWCEIHHRPYIQVSRKIKYADVSCDMITTGYRLDGPAMERIDALRPEPKGCYGRRGDAGPTVGFCVVEHIPLARADSVASLIFEIASTCSCCARQGGGE